MKKIENFCVSCGLPCMGKSCPNHSSDIYYCDECGEYAQYRIDDKEYCEFCVEEYLKNVFDSLNLSEKAELLNIEYENLNS